MKQLLQYMKDGKAVVEEVPIPTPKNKTALVRTGASLVSAGTERMVVSFAEKNLIGKAASRPDLVKQVLDKAKREGVLSTVEAAFNKLDEPMALGYSSSGIIEAIGPGLDGFKIGDRVACAGSGYAVHAEYAIVPQNLLVKIPDSVSYEAAAFATIAAISLQGFRLANPQIGENIAIIGAGLLGLITAEIAKAAGCKVMCIDLIPDRISLAEQMGHHAVLRPDAESASLTFTDGAGFDHILICADTSSNDPVELAGNIAREKANVVAVGAFGMDIPRKTYYAKELNLIVSRSYGPGRYDPQYEEYGHDYPLGYIRWTEGRNIAAIIDLLADEKINIAPMVTHRFPIEEAANAYHLITGKAKTPFLGVLLTYPIHSENVLKNTTPSTPPSTTQVHPRKQISMGMIGAGNYANAIFLPAIKKVGGINKVAIASSSGLKAANAAKKYQFSMATSDENDILEADNIELVAILTRHDSHAAQIIKAIKHSKHIFCEKPLALTENEVIDIAAAMEKNADLKLMIGFNRRFAPLTQRMKRFFLNNDEPMSIHYRINAGALPDSHWLKEPDVGGGRIIGEGCHFIDFMTYMIGKPPIAVSAAEIQKSGASDHENVVATYYFPDGSIGVMSYLANGDKSMPKENIEVFMGGKSAVLNDFRSLKLYHKGFARSFKSYFRQDKGQQNMWKTFLNSIMQKTPAPIPYHDLYQVTLASFYTLQSLRSGAKENIPPVNTLIRSE
ncbi:MAG: bi-domain-containing oxidoreductase [Anaerolineaceae bacterium]|nr:bi-domain-containing oxidoreductase [Anaerolineaceae bacterium]